MEVAADALQPPQPIQPPQPTGVDMEVAADADAADLLEVSEGSHFSPHTLHPNAPALATLGGSDVTARAAMALGLHRIAERVREGWVGSVGYAWPSTELQFCWIRSYDSGILSPSPDTLPYVPTPLDALLRRGWCGLRESCRRPPP